MSIVSEYESKYGYHCCTKEQYYLIKKLHKYMWQFCYELGRYRSWSRKTINKKQMPKLCQFITKFNIEIGMQSPYFKNKPIDNYIKDIWQGNERILPDAKIIDLLKQCKKVNKDVTPILEINWEEKKKLLEDIENYYQ